MSPYYCPPRHELSIIVFISSGVLDSVIKYTQQYYLPEDETILFLPVVFSVAFICGLIVLFFSRKKETFHPKNILWGFILGIPNYASIYFLFKTLEIKGFESSVIFPMNNMGIVAASSIFSFLLFKEHFTKLNWIGIALSIIAITLIAFS